MFTISRKCLHNVLCFEFVVNKSAVLGDVINLNNFRAEMTWFKFAKMHTWTELTVISVRSVLCGGPGSSIGIATDYGLDGPGIESRWGRDFPPVQTGPGAHPASCTMGTGAFPGVKCGRVVTLTTHPLLAPRSWKSRAIPLPPSGPVTGLLYFYLFYMTSVSQLCVVVLKHSKQVPAYLYYKYFQHVSISV